MGLTLFALFLFCAIYVQQRGDVHHTKLTRKISDHSNIMAPVNCLFYAFSGVRNTAYIDVDTFPELKLLQDNWEVIRDEAINLNAASRIKASDELDDLGFNSFLDRKSVV